MTFPIGAIPGIGAALGATRGPSPERGPLAVLREAESTGVGAG